MVRNPFYYGGTIQQPSLFVGRQREVEQIYQAIEGSANCSLVGERKIGKSSLLRYVADPTVEARNGLAAERTLMVYFDFSGRPTITQTDFWKRVLVELAGQIKRSDLATSVQAAREAPEIDWSDLEPLFQNLAAAGLRLVLLLDEFDLAAANAHLDAAFYGGLRNLTNNLPFCLVVASQRTLSELQYAHPETVTSPFFNTFRHLNIGPFTAEEVETLLTRALAGTEVAFTPLDRQFLEAWADSHPFFLQMAAYHLFEEYVRGAGRAEGAAHVQVAERMRDDGAEHFRYYWTHSDNGEKLILAVLSLLRSAEIARYQLPLTFDARMQKRLRDRALLTERTGRPGIFSSLFADWIVDEVSFITTEKAPDFQKALQEARIKGFQERWLDTSESLKRGFARIDAPAVAQWLVSEQGAERLVDLLGKLLKLLSP